MVKWPAVLSTSRWDTKVPVCVTLAESQKLSCRVPPVLPAGPVALRDSTSCGPRSSGLPPGDGGLVSVLSDVRLRIWATRLM